ncbi:MAG: type I DNA topoisomerase, partial [Planctomycetes bacterium]|nr:type I DNA topoisomerase [Planctomycetota bacterium]
AHEAIRPTAVERTPESVRQYLTEEQFKLYQLIWQRFVASQMKPALYEVTTVQVAAGRGLFQAKGRRVLFDGHTVLSGVEKAEDEQMLPALEPKQPLDLLKLEPTQHFTKPPPRYTEASLVRTMERLGIGRPSTYAPIIETIQQRGYVNQVERQFHATDLGIVVTDKLVQHFPQVLDVQFTSQMESELDKIEEAHADWLTILRNFYGPFKDALDKAGAEMTTVKEVTDEVCDKCGKPMAVRYSKHGKFLGCTGYPECKNLKPLADEAQMADEKCEKCGAPMVFKIWRKRRYVACTAYPTCKNMRQPGRPGSAEPKEPTKETGENCEKCGKPLVIRTGKRGPFIACSGFPKCRNAKPLPGSEAAPAQPPAGSEPAGGSLPKCEKCGAPMAIKVWKRRRFLACSAYPKCKNMKPAGGDAPKEPPKPTGENCEKCGQPLVIRTGPRGPFIGCSGYPKCRNAKPLPKPEPPTASPSDNA